MILSDFHKRGIKPIIIITLLAVLALSITGCESLGFPMAESPEPEPPPAAEAPPEVINADDRAILAVYELLLSQAKSHEAKVYLADFYATSDNWSAESELLKDGTSIWHVVVDMTDIKVWEEIPYWQQASWLVFQDGRVIPSNRFHGNALRIDADLQASSINSPAFELFLNKENYNKREAPPPAKPKPAPSNDS